MLAEVESRVQSLWIVIRAIWWKELIDKAFSYMKRGSRADLRPQLGDNKNEVWENGSERHVCYQQRLKFVLIFNCKDKNICNSCFYEILKHNCSKFLKWIKTLLGFMMYLSYVFLRSLTMSQSGTWWLNALGSEVCGFKSQKRQTAIIDILSKTLNYYLFRFIPSQL